MWERSNRSQITRVAAECLIAIKLVLIILICCVHTVAYAMIAGWDGKRGQRMNAITDDNYNCNSWILLLAWLT